MLAGPDLGDLTPAAASPRTGFETVLTAKSNQAAVEVIALDASGRTLGTVSTGPESSPSDLSGYVVARADGSVRSFGSTIPPSTAALRRGDRVVGVAASGTGLRIATATGDVIPLGALSYGSLVGVPLNAPIVGIADTPDGNGYWLVASDGGIFAFGDARFFGSMALRPLNSPIVGISWTADGNGYWLVASDGGVFSFGDARFHGSMARGSLNLVRPIVGMSWTPSGQRVLARGVGWWGLLVR